MLDEVRTVSDYLKLYGSSLAEKITKEAEPLFNPGDEWDEKMHTLLRKPFPAQGDVIMGVVKALEKQNSIIIVGECGAGKSLISIASTYISSNGGRPPRVLIMVPGHLILKLRREVIQTIPDAKTHIIRTLKDVMAIDTAHPNKVPEYYIISKDKAKLSYRWVPAVVKNSSGYRCPQCHELITNDDGIPVDFAYFKKAKRFCPNCRSALWQADNKKLRRFAISEYIKKYMKNFYDFCIFDEVHELKGGSTAQGNAFGALSSAAKKTIALTGTLVGGYSSNFHYINFRLNPKRMKDEDIGYHQLSKWVSRYGVLERITRHYEDEDNRCSKGKKSRTVLREKPGLSPAVFSRHLLSSSVFLRLEDISVNLPPLSEEVVQVKMDEELEEAYKELENKLASVMRAELQRGSKKLLSVYLINLLAYPDSPFECKSITQDRDGVEVLIAVPQSLLKSKIYNKERQLIKLVKEEKSQNRKVFVYCQYTGTRDMTGRLKEILSNEGLKVEVLKSTVTPEKREEWIAEKVKQGVDVIIANPKLVETGLDLYDFPTLIFFQTGYSIFTLRQASRRSWRIGQKKPVKVYYLFYQDTMQEKALQLMGSKLEASLAIEGKFTEEGLVALTSGEDMTTALAKALVDGLETEGVEQIWRKINEKNQPQKTISLTEEEPRGEDKVAIKEEKVKEDPNKTVVIEFTKFISRKKKQIERVEVKASELEQVLEERGQSAQLSLF